MPTRKAKNNRYGYDIAFAEDIRKNASVTFGVDLIKNAMIGRLKDKLWYAPEYGYPLEAKIRANKTNDFSKISREAEIELLKDSRIATCTVKIIKEDTTVNVKIFGTTAIEDNYELISKINDLNIGSLIFI
jgi:hypothetical protein